MHIDAQVLRAIARISRSGKPPSLIELDLWIHAEPAAIRTSLVRLARSELVQRRGDAVHLTMLGLALAVAAGARVDARRTVRRSRKLRAA